MTKKCETNPYKTRVPPYLSTGLVFNPEDNMTKQAMKAECDINNIMAKYQRTGMMTHISKYTAQYGDFYEIDFQEAQETLLAGQQMFDELPATVRKRFENDPAQFMSFCQNPENRSDLAKMGLLNENAILDDGPPEIVPEKSSDE